MARERSALEWANDIADVFSHADALIDKPGMSMEVAPGGRRVALRYTLDRGIYGHISFMRREPTYDLKDLEIPCRLFIATHPLSVLLKKGGMDYANRIPATVSEDSILQLGWLFYYNEHVVYPHIRVLREIDDPDQKDKEVKLKVIEQFLGVSGARGRLARVNDQSANDTIYPALVFVDTQSITNVTRVASNRLWHRVISQIGFGSPKPSEISILNERARILKESLVAKIQTREEIFRHP